MPQYEIKGETFIQALPLELAESREFNGVEVYRFWGTRANIDFSMSSFEHHFRESAIVAFGDAKWLGKIKTATNIWDDLYELIVMRKGPG